MSVGYAVLGAIIGYLLGMLIVTSTVWRRFISMLIRREERYHERRRNSRTNK
jgi:ABC-type nitrate/sulfonate/bicarbonate transport system permease component